MGYDLLNIGDTDLALGVECLELLQKKSKIPFISANLKDKKTGKPIFEPYLIKDIDGLRVGIIGILTPNIHPNIQKEMKNSFVDDPIEVASETIKGPLSNCDHIFVLAHLNPSEVEDLAKKVPQLSIMIGGNDRYFSFPRKMNHSIYAQTDAFGAHIGRMNLNLLKESSEFFDVLPGTLLQRNIEKIEREIEDLKNSKEARDMEELKGKLLRQKERLPDAKGKSTYENFLTLLHPGVEPDPEIVKLIAVSKDQLKRPIPW